MGEMMSNVGSLTFSRHCWVCKLNKDAPGGTIDKRTKMWSCAGCSQEKVQGKVMQYMEWKAGNPPSVGWWPTKHFLNAHQGAYRWWDGECWSWPAFAHESAAKAAHWATKQDKTANIQWAERPADWPERSRT